MTSEVSQTALGLTQKAKLISAFLLFIFGLSIVLEGTLLSVRAPNSLALIVFTGFLVLFSSLLLIAKSYVKTFYSYFPPLLHPPVLIGLWFLALYGFPTLLVFFDENIRSGIPVRFELADIASGWFIVVVGMVCIVVGYIFSVGKPKHNTPLLYSVPSIGLLIGLYIVSVAFRLVNTLVEGRGYGRNIDAWGTFGVLFNNTMGYFEQSFLLVIVVLLFLVRKTGRYRSLFYTILTLEILFAATIGFSSEMVFLLLTVGATAFYLFGHAIITKYWILAVLGIFLGIGIVPVTETLRTYAGTYDSTAPAEVISATARAFNESWGQGLDHGWQMFTQKFIGRQTGTSIGPGLVVSRTPSIVEYKGVEEFLLIPAYIVPRFIWTTKPVLTTGAYYSVTYFDRPESIRTASAITIFGEAYTYFGIGSVIIGMFSLGILFGRIYYFTVVQGKPYILLALIPSFIHIEGQFSVLFVGLLQNALVYIFLHWLLTSISPQGLHETGIRQPKSSIQSS